MTAKVAQPDALIGQIVGGRFEILRQIGKGGMGAIYEVRNTRLGRSFALKTLTGDAVSDEEALARFRREADSIARLNHAHIVDVIDWETLADGSPCIVMEYLQGEDLAARIKSSSPLDLPFIARIADEVLSALSVAHRAGIVHRDLKPQNIFLATDDAGEVERAKLLDFGVSKIRDNAHRTSDARLIGTPSYMSPEQAEGRSADVGPATDVWAMGAILYEMMTSIVAFEAPSIPATLYKICSQDPEPIERYRSDVPAELVAVIKRALTRDFTQRTPDVDTLRTELRDTLRAHGGVYAARRTPPIGVRTVDPASPYEATMSGAGVAPSPAIQTTLSSMARGISPRATPRSPKLIAAASVAAISGAVVIWFAMRDTPSGRPPVSLPATLPGDARVTSLDVVPVDAAPAAHALEDVTIELRSAPAGAQVFRDGTPIGTTPFTERSERGPGARVYVVKRTGYVDKRVEVTAEASRTVDVELERAPPAKIQPRPVPCRKKGEPVDPFNKKPPCPT